MKVIFSVFLCLCQKPAKHAAFQKKWKIFILKIF